MNENTELYMRVVDSHILTAMKYLSRAREYSSPIVKAEFLQYAIRDTVSALHDASIATGIMIGETKVDEDDGR